MNTIELWDVVMIKNVNTIPTDYQGQSGIVISIDDKQKYGFKVSFVNKQNKMSEFLFCSDEIIKL